MKTLGTYANGHRLERIKASPLWKDGSFQNKHPILPEIKAQASTASLRHFLWTYRTTPIKPLPTHDPIPAWLTPNETGLRATWLGHSTVLIEIDGLRVLTDPVWSERISPITNFGPRRFQPVPVAIKDLPPIDLVLISHDHYDHLDYDTVIALARLKVPFVVSLGVGSHLEHWGIPARLIHELDWWETYSLPYGALQVTATPAQHFSGRFPRAKNDTLWSSFSVKSERHSFFFSGDTGLTPEFEEIQRRLGRFDLVMLEIGSYHPFWAELHLGPKFAVDAHRMLGGGCLLPIHWGTFNLSTHPWDDPAEQLYQSKTNLPLAMPQIGEALIPSRVHGVTPWWR